MTERDPGPMVNRKSITQTSVPIEIRINCPECGVLHVDKGVWATKPHHTHSCQDCGHTWRPAVVDTVGVNFLPGFRNANAEEKPAEDGIIYRVLKTQERRGTLDPVKCGACHGLNMWKPLDRFGYHLDVLVCRTCGAMEKA
jgi:NAD-dependent SIR2 family protein deacetylase